MSRWGRRATAAGFGAAVALVAVLGVLSIVTVRAQIESERRADRSFAIRAALGEIQTSSASAQAARRGFALTGDEIHVRRFEALVPEIEKQLRLLGSLLPDEPAWRASLARLEHGLRERIEEMRQAIADRRERGLDLATESARIEAAIARSEETRAVVRSLLREENELEHARADASAANARRALALAASGGLSAVLLLALAGVASWREIARRERAEEELARRNRLLDSVLDAMSDWVMALDEHGELLLLNRSARQSVPPELLSRPLSEWSTGLQTRRTAGGEPLALEEYPVVRALRGESVDGEQLVTRPLGVAEDRFVSCSAQPIRDGEEVVRGAVLVTRDVTAERRAEMAVVEANRRLAALAQELEAFAYSVSHDLRAPLRHVDGFAALLARHLGDGLDERGRHYLDTISAAARQMGRLIDDLLSFSRMGRAEMACGKVDLGPLVAEVIGEVSPPVEEREIVWRVGSLPRVRGDRAMLRVALVNLLANAVKFTRHRRPAHIEVAAERDGDGRVVLSVADDGAGFDPEYGHKLFGVFQRLHRIEEFEGTGIGLAIVRQVVHRHGGEVRAEGRPEAGATFSITLPAEAS